MIRLSFDGAEKVEVDHKGDLVMHIGSREVRLRRPVIYQETGTERQLIDRGFEVDSGSEHGFQNLVTFQVAEYDASRPLIIDPVLVYSTFVGGDGTPDSANDIAVDATGNAYVTGNTNSASFPTTAGAYQENLSASSPAGQYDAFVTKLNPSGSGLVYSTYIGDGHQETGTGIALTSDESVFVTINSNGFTLTKFPLIDPLPELQGLPLAADGAVVRLDASGSTLLFSTLIGSSTNDSAHDVVVDSSGNAYVTGSASANDFPTTAGVSQPNFAGVVDAFVLKISSAPTMFCTGFDSPLDSGPVTVRKNRVLPLKAQIFDESGSAITDIDLSSPPVIQVMFSSGAGSAIDVTEDALPAGQGSEGNQFVFGTDKWRFNLKTKEYAAVGTYTVTLESGDTFEYKVDSCEAQFVIKP